MQLLTVVACPMLRGYWIALCAVAARLADQFRRAPAVGLHPTGRIRTAPRLYDTCVVVASRDGNAPAMFRAPNTGGPGRCVSAGIGPLATEDRGHMLPVAVADAVIIGRPTAPTLFLSTQQPTAPFHMTRPTSDLIITEIVARKAKRSAEVAKARTAAKTLAAPKPVATPKKPKKPAAPTLDELLAKPKAELIDIARAAGLPTSGTKAALAARIVAVASHQAGVLAILTNAR